MPGVGWGYRKDNLYIAPTFAYPYWTYNTTEQNISAFRDVTGAHLYTTTASPWSVYLAFGTHIQQSSKSYPATYTSYTPIPSPVLFSGTLHLEFDPCYTDAYPTDDSNELSTMC